jgi:hypothetical protein
MIEAMTILFPRPLPQPGERRFATRKNDFHIKGTHERVAYVGIRIHPVSESLRYTFTSSDMNYMRLLGFVNRSLVGRIYSSVSDLMLQSVPLTTQKSLTS